MDPVLGAFRQRTSARPDRAWQALTPEELLEKASGGAKTAAAGAGSADAAADDGEAKTSSNAFGVPDYLIERSANARVRLAAKG